MMAGRANRHVRMLQSGLLIVGHRRAHVSLLDVSPYGALCAAAEPPACGCDALIEALATRLPARIIWASGRRFGASFYGEAPEDWLELLAMAGPCPSAGTGVMEIDRRAVDDHYEATRPR